HPGAPAQAHPGGGHGAFQTGQRPARRPPGARSAAGRTQAHRTGQGHPDENARLPGAGGLRADAPPGHEPATEADPGGRADHHDERPARGLSQCAKARRTGPASRHFESPPSLHRAHNAPALAGWPSGTVRAVSLFGSQRRLPNNDRGVALFRSDERGTRRLFVSANRADTLQPTSPSRARQHGTGTMPERNPMNTSFWKSGHTPTLFAAFLYFDLSFMV